MDERRVELADVFEGLGGRIVDLDLLLLRKAVDTCDHPIDPFELLIAIDIAMLIAQDSNSPDLRRLKTQATVQGIFRFGQPPALPLNNPDVEPDRRLFRIKLNGASKSWHSLLFSFQAG